MFLTKIGVRPNCALSFRSLSKVVSSVIAISVMAVSMPAAPRVLVEAANRLPQILTPYVSIPTFEAPSMPTIDAAPLSAIYTNSLAFAANVKTTVLPSLPAGLESAKMPTLGERTYAFFAPTLPLKTSRNATLPPPQPPSVVDFDFDSDGKADIGRWHSANTELKVKNSGGGSDSIFTVGSSSAKVTPGDFNGDGKTDAAVFSSGTWTYKTGTSATAQTISWGASSDIPVAGDYDGDGTTDAAVYRPSTMTWWILKSGGGNTSTTFGNSGDVALPGDYDGDGKNDLALYRPSTGDWHITGSTAGYYYFHWGIAIDTPVPADYDGDGKTDPAVFRPSTGTWYVYRSGLNDGSYYTQAWGNYADQPVPADYDGDNKADYAIWRPTTGVWYTIKSSDSSHTIETLGVPGDIAVPSAYLKQVGGQVTGDALATARLAPRNATGGTDLYSQNFSWGTSLVSLPGRAGLDAGFGISYNSLVWTKVGNAMVFDPDYSNASPGFRFGFPTIEPIYYDDDKDAWAYMMVTPSGGRVQFRQTAVTNVYETADSSYAQLVVSGATSPNDPVENLTIMVRSTDGTQLSYAWAPGAYRCTQIRDRNGNYITIAYDGEARLNKVTDTLGREINVGYDTTTGYPSTITQDWKGSNGSGNTTTHTWATLSYDNLTIDTNFHSSITSVVGPPEGTVVKVLERITYADGSSTRFSHNAYGQVWKVQNYAADDHELNYTRTDLATVSGTPGDCPRFGETATKVEYFNNGNEVSVTNTLTTGMQAVDMDSVNVPASMIQVTLQNHPNGNITNTYVHDAGWKEGLPIRADDYANGNGVELKRSSLSRWVHDSTNQNITYPINPRVTETRVSDGVNTKKTAIEYHPISTNSPVALYGLVKKVEVGSLSTVYKKVETEYELDSAYVSRRIIGLPSQVEAWGKNDTTQSLECISKVTYNYDEGDFSQETNQIVAPTRHDGTNYGSTFIVGRGNMTSTARHDVTGATAASVTNVRYDIAGSPVARVSPWNGTTTRTVRIGYADNFNSTVGVSTYAYPTVVTDPAGTTLGDSGHSSFVRYRYDIGAKVEASSQAPAGNSHGKTTKQVYYDDTGRLKRDSVYIYVTEHAYRRYEYPTNGNQSKVYSTIVDSDGDGDIAEDEVLSEAFTDGAGRVRMSRTPHTFSGGSTATWAGTLIEYDIAGRIKSQSVPTEVDSSWSATGDDSARGFLWTHQKYDWMGRVIRKINTDGIDQTTLNDSDILYTYQGCGCAGATATTVESERVPIPGTSNYARRKQKAYADVLVEISRARHTNGTVRPFIRAS